MVCRQADISERALIISVRKLLLRHQSVSVPERVEGNTPLIPWAVWWITKRRSRIKEPSIAMVRKDNAAGDF